MALNIKSAEVERLAAELAAMTGTTKTGALLDALRERHASLLRQRSRKRKVREIREFLEREVWPAAARSPAPDRSDDDILGYGPAGV
jgi:antitoxin VapB